MTVKSLILMQVQHQGEYIADHQVMILQKRLGLQTVNLIPAITEYILMAIQTLL